MRWSQAFIPTLRDDPADAEAPSHRLLVRGGYIRQLIAGSYTLLPIAHRVRAKIRRIIEEEMDAIGAQQVMMPALHPAELWQRSGRYDIMGEELFHLQDRRGSELVLGMTHEENISSIASTELTSYRQLPQSWYQIQTKFRDEPRPKSGLLRTREFTMKDSYSFDIDTDGLDRSFDLHAGAYRNIFARFGVEAVAVNASSGAMGGTGSVEFMVKAESGEDDVVHCRSCGYAANVERAASRLAPHEDAETEPVEAFDTPGVRTIDALTTFPGGAAADRQIKTLVMVIDNALTLVLLRGDHQLQEQKLSDGTAATTVRPAVEEEIRELLGAGPGSLGAVGVEGVRIVADHALKGRVGLTTGANVDDQHLRNVDVDRDIAVTEWLDLREVTDGEPCDVCGSALEVFTAIEVGHIFKLGTRYSEYFDLHVLDAEGERRIIQMGCYGIGLERNLAAVVEASHDDRGIVWPIAVAPYEVVVTVVKLNDPETLAAAEALYSGLRSAGVDVLIDDRDERPGVKFNDAELIGIPLRLTVGPRGVAAGEVELTFRASGETETVSLDDAVARVTALVDEGRTGRP